MSRWWWASTLALLGACSDAPDVPHLEWPPTVAIPLVHAAANYVATVAIGAQMFPLIVDTGSSTTVVAGASCSACASAGVTALYSPGATAKDTGNQASGMYLDFAAWDGEIYSDEVGLGSGAPSVPLDLVAMTNEMGFFEDGVTAGILGMGPTQSLDGDTTAYQNTAVVSGAPNVVAFELCSGSGTMWIGEPDASASSGSISYTPLTGPTASAPYYNVSIIDIAIGGTSLGFGASTYKSTSVDTGTTDLVIPTEAFDMLVAQVDASPGAAALFPSQSLGAGCLAGSGVTAAQVDAMLPAMSTSFDAPDGTAFDIAAPPTRSYLTDDGSGSFCLAVEDGGSGDEAVTILGDAFMRAFVTVLDLDHERAGFALETGCGDL